MIKLIRVITDELDVETTIVLNEDGSIADFHRGCLPDFAVEGAIDILCGLDLRRAASIAISFDGDDAESHIVWNVTGPPEPQESV